MKAYLEKNGDEWMDDFVYSSREMLLRRDIEVVPFDGNYLKQFINNTIFEPDDILIGSVEATKAFWNKLNFKVPNYIGYPKCLEEFYGRTIKSTRFGKLKIEDLPIFIKPAIDIKLFTGFVLDNNSTLSNIAMYYSEVNPNTKIFTSEPIDIISEYRCFVHKGELVGMKHYSGSFQKFPDMFEVKMMIEKFKNEAPVSYTLDIGIIKKGTEEKTVLIEINDFWAIGGYGLDSKIYVKMLIDRFQQIKNS
jgi:hypothetical protein